MSGGIVLVLNAGSSSLKFETFEVDGAGLVPQLRGQVEGIGRDARFAAGDRTGATVADEDLDDAALREPAAALEWLSAWLERRFAGGRLLAVGHRVAHGGANHHAPLQVDAAVLDSLELLVPLAPLHQPHNLAPIRRLLDARPELPQVACFDTAFHRTQPIEAQLFALPRHFFDEGIRRYGFHGLSYEYVARTMGELAPDAAAGRTVVAHLGNGVSMCAMVGGRSIATTMGFTALEGCPMGTRSGSLDPGVVLHLARERRMALDDIETLLYRESGLLGLSGVSSDMRELLASESAGARLALEYFVYRLAREAASLAAAMGGIDAIVFTAGIGENSPWVRAQVCARLAWTGLSLDEDANLAGGPRISRAGSRVSAWRLPTNEERMIAQHTCRVLGIG